MGGVEGPYPSRVEETSQVHGAVTHHPLQMSRSSVHRIRLASLGVARLARLQPSFAKSHGAQPPANLVVLVVEFRHVKPIAHFLELGVIRRDHLIATYL